MTNISSASNYNTDSSGFYVQCIYGYTVIIRKSSARSRSETPLHRCTLGLGKDTTRSRGVSAAAAVRTSLSVVMVCRSLQMRATRVPLYIRSSYSHCLLYSRTSDNGPSEKRTTSLQRTLSVLNYRSCNTVT